MAWFSFVLAKKPKILIKRDEEKTPRLFYFKLIGKFGAIQRRFGFPFNSLSQSDETNYFYKIITELQAYQIQLVLSGIAIVEINLFS